MTLKGGHEATLCRQGSELCSGLGSFGSLQVPPPQPQLHLTLLTSWLSHPYCAHTLPVIKQIDGNSQLLFPKSHPRDGNTDIGGGMVYDAV